MKLSKIAMVSCFFLILSIAKAEPTWVQLPGGTQDKEPKLTVLESSNTGTIINLKTSGAWVEDVSEKNVVFKRITLEGQGQTDETGKPGLPVFNKLVAIPATAEVTVEVISKNEAVLKNYLVYPAQQEVISAKPSFEIDDGFYIQDALYPNEIVEVSAPAIMNDVRLVRLCVYPFRYNPAKRELRVITDITIRLSYSGYDGRNTLERRSDGVLPEWERIYKSSILNYSDLYTQSSSLGEGGGGGGGPEVTPPGYLIICVDEFFDTTTVGHPLHDFIEWKRQKGLQVHAVDLNDVRNINGQPDDVDDLKQFIYGLWWDLFFPVDYVLLVGDAPYYNSSYSESDIRFYLPVQCGSEHCIPTYGSYPYVTEGGDNQYLFSDYYYQLMSEDEFPDFFLGRWCPRDLAELNNYFQKTKKYELAGSTNWRPDWILFAAHHGEGNNNYFKLSKEQLDTIVAPKYEEYGSVDGTSDDVIAEIESANGVGIVNYQGHGSPVDWNGWGANHRSLFSIEVRELDNQDRYPVVYNLCCHNGKIMWLDEGDNESMVEAWTRAPKAAVGAMGASKASWIFHNNLFDHHIFYAHFHDALDLGCGAAIDYGKTKLMERGSKYDVENARMYYWIGDPEIDVWRAQPQSAYVVAPHEFYQGQEYVDAYVRLASDNSAVPGAKVCLYYFGPDPDYYYQKIAYTNALGFIRIYLPFYLEEGNYYLTITKQTNPVIRPIVHAIAYHGSMSPGMGNDESQPELISWQLKSVLPEIVQSYATISYSIAGYSGSGELQRAELSVFDASGRKVKTLFAGNNVPGHYEVTWDASNESGERCGSGVYFVRMQAADFQAREKVTIIR